jgi:hypothetical protein
MTEVFLQMFSNHFGMLEDYDFEEDQKREFNSHKREPVKYQPKNQTEKQFLKIYYQQGSDILDHLFSIPGIYMNERLSPLFWAVYLDIPEIVEEISRLS